MTDLQKSIKDKIGSKMALSVFVRDVKDKCLMSDDGFGEVYYKETGDLLEGICPFDMIDTPRLEMKKYVVMWFNK